MTSTPREIGTLVVVILKANHLPNKRHIGKQDPYCAVTFNGETKRTKALKRGGQHPEWDEEVRFTIYEEEESANSLGNGTPPPPPPKSGKGPKKVKGGKSMKLACYADDIREPDFIGDASVDLREVLTKGESDDWYTLMSKDRFAGKVYIEMTFWSNEPEPPPKKPATQTISKNSQLYAGPGSFTEHSANGQTNRAVSGSFLSEHTRRVSDSYSSTIRASSSLAGLDLYQAPYEQPADPVDGLAQNFSEFGVSQSRRRESLPLPQSSRPASSVGFSTFSSQPSRMYNSAIPEDSSGFYDRPVTPTGHPTLYHQSSISSHHLPYTQASYQPDYDAGYQQPPPPPPSRGPRFSIPATSSGFMPLSSSSTFVPSSESSTFAPPPSHTPAPTYDQSHFSSQTSYAPTPAPPPAQAHSTIPPSSSFAQPSDSVYPTYGTSSAPPPQQYMSAHVPPVPVSSQSVPPDPSHFGYSEPPPSSSIGPGGSRPLPQPQGPPAPVLPPFAIPPSGGQHYSPSHIVQASTGLPSIPPPPPLPSTLASNHSRSSLSPSPRPRSPEEYQQNSSSNLPLPPPPPPPQFNPRTPIRRASLPQPPSNPPRFQSLPPVPSLVGQSHDQYAVQPYYTPPRPSHHSSLPVPPQNVPPPPLPVSNGPAPGWATWQPDPTVSQY
ncbi:hypothetical protein K435DRAFT_851962 [Dendrothele bispora CBS 962.96]|uniref:C2 domain-containing protein n=1 Tax=Dendrothele bispora (strain CBS 962.96) TaxID=1314807 RepID=A0A4S8MM34_DENBC|nr:hypothetical protein K435DRAFT_851962 [Dendrothele bispora CBS 962.96]